jgi:hypothetical protein
MRRVGGRGTDRDRERKFLEGKEGNYISKYVDSTRVQKINTKPSADGSDKHWQAAWLVN